MRTRKWRWREVERPRRRGRGRRRIGAWLLQPRRRGEGKEGLEALTLGDGETGLNRECGREGEGRSGEEEDEDVRRCLEEAGRGSRPVWRSASGSLLPWATIHRFPFQSRPLVRRRESRSSCERRGQTEGNRPRGKTRGLEPSPVPVRPRSDLRRPRTENEGVAEEKEWLRDGLGRRTRWRG